LSAHNHGKHTSFVLTDDFIIDSAFGPWATMAMYAEDLVSRYVDPSLASHTQWAVTQVCFERGLYQDVPDGRAFMCGRFDADSPLIKALREDVWCR
jgi:hypothetical protein